ncbi:GNAT family N-acetyltransferase [Clostridium sp. C8-1-8]|uniref:GNAT family N-acetyltransferase n=1 Tax=Clostridium sp. C8-1-8 TaxID=2698831 RepID=UPI00136C6A00|nr:GNAT family N-acetyltransferase [Clostridium sp. C8-1-8]
MEYEIFIYSRPGKDIVKRIKEITELLTVKWFTNNVPEDTERDLMFQDVVCLSVDGLIVSFIMFTCLDGTINISIMGTDPDYRWKGFGTTIINYFFKYVKSLGFKYIRVFTVPPEVKISYKETLSFYEKNGFKIEKRYTELWENGAIELIKDLQDI